MASTRSYYKTLLRSDWRRFWPIPVGYTVIWFFLMPAMILSGNANLSPAEWDVGRNITAEMLGEKFVMSFVQGLPMAGVCMGLLLGVALFSYLMQTRSVGLMHSLPATRTTQFFGHCLSGVVMFTIPNLFIVVTTFLALAMQGAASLNGLAVWFIVAELETFFFFMFAVLCCMATGWLLAVPVIFFGLNFVYIAYEALLRLQVSLFYWGCEDGLNNISSAAEYLTPIVAMANRVGDYTYDHNLEWGRYTILEGGIGLLVIYTVVALGMGAFAFFLYRIRHSESAMDPIVFPWLRPIVSAVISTAGGMALGCVIAAIFGWLYDSFLMVALCQILCGAVIAIIMEMILQKTYKVFNPTAYKRAGAVILFIIVLVVGARLDPFGVQKYVPDTDDVESVNIYSSYVDRSTLVEPEAIDKVRDIHIALLPPVDIVYSSEAPLTHYCSIRYYMKNGTTVYRSYEYYEDNEAVSEAMDELLKIEEVRKGMVLRSYSWRNGVDDSDIGTDFTGGWFNVWSEDENNEGQLTKDECLQLYNALMRDVKNNLHHVSDYSNSAINLSLETKLGSYELVRLYPECTNTIDLLLAMGVVESAYELFQGPVDLPATYGVPTDTADDVVLNEDVNLDPNSFPDPSVSSSLGIIGGTDGPTQVIVAAKNYVVAG